MTRKVLLPSEWAELDGTPLGLVWRDLPTKGIAILAVMDDDGAIVGHWSAFQCAHAEQVWVHPNYRGRTVVARHLLAGMGAIVNGMGANAFITAAEAPGIERIITHLGGTKTPGTCYTVPVTQVEERS